MRNFNKIILALGILVSFAACNSDSEKRAQRVETTRERVADKSNDLREQLEDVQDQQADVNEAQAALAQARVDFMRAVDEQLADVENKITLAKTKPGFDAARVIQLQAEANALRTQAADTSRAFSVDSERTELDRIMNEIHSELRAE